VAAVFFNSILFSLLLLAVFYDVGKFPDIENLIKANNIELK
jgi:hypothetical protein